MTEELRVATRFSNEQPLAIGRIVHFVLQGRDHAEKLVVRPAIVVQPWGLSCANLQVFHDGSNDRAKERAIAVDAPHSLTTWVTSATYDEGEMRDGEMHYNQYTWHWPPRS